MQLLYALVFHDTRSDHQQSRAFRPSYADCQSLVMRAPHGQNHACLSFLLQATTRKTLCLKTNATAPKCSLRSFYVQLTRAIPPTAQSSRRPFTSQWERCWGGWRSGPMQCLLSTWKSHVEDAEGDCCLRRQRSPSASSTWSSTTSAGRCSPWPLHASTSVTSTCTM